MEEGKTKIKAEIVGHSLSPQGDELISVLCTFPRIILAEVNTHRMLSKNTSSSRAIPFNKMVEAIENNPFIPIAWQKSHSGMQGSEYLTGLDYDQAKFEWLEAKDRAIEQAQKLSEIGTTKQLCNRLLEPFMWTTMLITGSKEGWDNFFNLRCPQYHTPVSGEGFYAKSWKELISWHSNESNLKLLEENEDNWLFKLQHNKGQAEIHMMTLAEAIYDAMNESTPKQLQAGEWHIPFEDKIKDPLIWKLLPEGIPQPEWAKLYWETKVKISTAMAARTSYTVVGEEKEVDYSKMIELHDKLLSQNPPHSSPLEHCARAMSDDEYYSFTKGKIYYPREGNISVPYGVSGWCNNLKGFIPYRYMIDNNLTF